MEEKSIVLQTPRLTLRRMTPEDFDALCTILQDERVMYAYEGAFDDAQVEQWLANQLRRYREEQVGLWLVELRESGEVIGQCGLTWQQIPDRRVLEVGYLFRYDFWHQGYAAEAAAACRDYAFDTMGAEEVFSIIRDTNLPSQKVAQRNGMTRQGSFVKHYRGVDMPHYIYSVRRTHHKEMDKMEKETKQVTVAIAGLGSRGRWTYGELLLKHPDMNAKVVAIAEPLEDRRQEAAQAFGLAPEQCYETAEEMLTQPRLADVLFVCTQDQQHAGHALPALEKGYHLLLEKPVSPHADECRRIEETAQRLNRQVAVCHVLRYTPFFGKIHQLIQEGAIGDVVSIQAIENVAYWHQAHSFVRGNWRSSDTTSPMILQKSCHDMDILLWLAGSHCARVSSYGSLSLFRPENAPAGSADRCVDCQARENCPYDAEKIYLTNPATGLLHGHTQWPCNVLALHPTEENIRKAIAEGPYGRCVYRCDNNVVDHQVVNLELENGATVNFTMCAFTSGGGRTVKVMGTMGDIWADMDQNVIRCTPFGGETTEIDVRTLSDDLSGHGGGDRRLLTDFLQLVRTGGTEGTRLTNVADSVESHYVALAAEYSRLHGGQSVEPAQALRT